MALSIAQGYEYTGDDYWKWWVWLEGADEELDAVASVEYHLHPTFPKPVRKIKDRATKFRLDAFGWGVFHLQAHVEMRAGTTLTLGHVLELSYPDDTDDEGLERAPTRGEPVASSKRSVFLSAGTADSAVASELRSGLIDRGFEVLSDEDIEPGMPWEIEIENALKRSDAMITVSSDIPSTWVEREVGAAAMQGKKVIPVVVGDNPVVPKGLEAFQHIRVTDTSALGEATASIIDALDA